MEKYRRIGGEQHPQTRSREARLCGSVPPLSARASRVHLTFRGDEQKAANKKENAHTFEASLIRFRAEPEPEFERKSSPRRKNARTDRKEEGGREIEKQRKIESMEPVSDRDNWSAAR